MGEILELINRMSPYILLGFFLAGIMHTFVPAALYHKYLGRKSFRSVLNAAILGIPIPLCSCGVIPTAMSLKKEGASKGATVSFLIATPQTGVDSIIATYSLMGLPFALLRPLAALFTSLFGGQMVNIFDKDKEEMNEKTAAPAATKSSFGAKVVEVFRYAYIEMMQDIGRWLIVGLVVAGLITVFVPQSFFALFSDNSLLSMLIVLVFAIPMYLCATGSIPIAVALMMKGLSPGTALVLLMAGPAVNAASMLVVGKVLGKKTLLIYILSIVLGSILFGLGIDYLLPREWFTAAVTEMASGSGPSVFNMICTAVLLVLLSVAMFLRFRQNRKCTDEACVNDEHIYKVEGLRCNRCRENAEKAIASIPGVESVSIDLASGDALVKGIFDEESMTKAVEALGFKVIKQ